MLGHATPDISKGMPFEMEEDKYSGGNMLDDGMPIESEFYSANQSEREEQLSNPDRANEFINRQYLENQGIESDSHSMEMDNNDTWHQVGSSPHSPMAQEKTPTFTFKQPGHTPAILTIMQKHGTADLPEE